MGKYRLFVLTCSLFLIFVVGFAFAADKDAKADETLQGPGPFKEPILELLDYFKPMNGSVVSSTDGALTISLNKNIGLLEGMRLQILRKGSSFIHPITKEVVGQTESPVGKIVVSDVGVDKSTVTLSEGEALPGDIARITSGRISALFYQSDLVDWDLSEEYFFWLKDTGRFAVIETAPGTATEEEVGRMAKERKAEIAIMLLTSGDALQTTLTQKLIWADTGEVFSSIDFDISQEFVAQYKAGDDFFKPKKHTPVVVHKIPYTASNIAVADVNGDGEKELIASIGSSLILYKLKKSSLAPAFDSREAPEIKSDFRNQYIWLQALNLDDDPQAEILVTAKRENHPISFIYKYIDGKFEIVWQINKFARVIFGKLYVQNGNPDGGYKGDVSLIDWRDESGEVGAALKIPAFLNIYDFAILPSRGGIKRILAYDKKGKMALYNEDGLSLWKSKDYYGGYLKYYPKTHLGAGIQEGNEYWKVTDRLISRGTSALAFKRVPSSTNMKGLGLKKSLIMGLFTTGTDITEVALVDGIKGEPIDYAVADNKLYVLVGSYGMNFANILKGRKLFTSKLIVYSFKGK